MGALIDTKLHEKIAEMLLQGQDAITVSKEIGCDQKEVLRVIRGADFMAQTLEFLDREVRLAGIMAVRNIKQIANSDEGSKATRLKANQWLAEKALEVASLGDSATSPATMTQEQLARRLKELQGEALKRAKPINTGVIEHEPATSLEDLL